MKKRLVGAAVIGGVFLIGAAAFVKMQGPMYELGSVAKEESLRGPLEPPKQTTPDVWQVEPDIQLHFEAHGEGRPALIVHGGPGIPYTKQWEGLRSLEEDFRFYYYHQRGCGESTRPFDRFEDGSYFSKMTKLEQTLGLGAQIADIERIRRILKQEKLILIGHSFGGFIATLYAAEFPDRVEKLVLVAPAGVLTAPEGERDLFAQTRTRLPAEDKEAFDEVLKEYLNFGSIFEKSDEELASLHAQLGPFILKAMGYPASAEDTSVQPGGWVVFALYFSAGRSPNFMPALPLVKAPTLVLYGEGDEIAIPGSTTYSGIPGSRVMPIKGEREGRAANHFVFDDSPALFSRALRGFLETAGG